MLNEIIKVDLHIHSALSRYKEDTDDILECDIEHINILLNKLEENQINLFSITDHNRFDFNLYKKIKEDIKKGVYTHIKNILPGIEFDVQLETGKPACHIITIFDDYNAEQLENIQNILEEKFLTSKDGYYTLKEYEDILYKIGLSTILVAHQKTGLDKNDYKTKSLSEATSCPDEWIRTGYISALEYKQIKVQGMIRRNLKDINRKLATITGSDCHKWECYPNKDEHSCTQYITKIKCLPTFKGLVFAFTSPETRFDRRLSQNTNKYIKEISINDKRCILSQGINVIIGDNASGKTYLLERLAGHRNTIYNDLNKINNIQITNVGELKLTYIKQNQIISNVREGTLFEDKNEYYKDILTKDEFSNQITNVMDGIKQYINLSIEKNEETSKLENITFPIAKERKQERYYPILNKDISISNNSNELRLTNINAIYKSLKEELDNNVEYYKAINTDREKLLNPILDLIKIVEQRKKYIDLRNKIKNIIISAIDNMNLKIKTSKTSAENENDEYIENIRESAKNLANSLKILNTVNKYPNFPKKIKGISINHLMGFEFIKKAKYNDLDLEDEFYTYMFVKDYQNKQSIKEIKTKAEFVNSISGITSYENIDTGIQNNCTKFINTYKKEERYIHEVNGETKIGDTPGEISLTFYKILLTQDLDSDVILIDQPEDDISVKRIEEYLQSYLESMRDKKQIIFVTHNPLLVVNLDVDNVIYVNKDKENVINIFSGCLEYEEDKSIIDIVGDNLDGGYDTIERRLKIYGRR